MLTLQIILSEKKNHQALFACCFTVSDFYSKEVFFLSNGKHRNAFGQLIQNNIFSRNNTLLLLHGKKLSVSCANNNLCKGAKMLCFVFFSTHRSEKVFITATLQWTDTLVQNHLLNSHHNNFNSEKANISPELEIIWKKQGTYIWMI